MPRTRGGHRVPRTPAAERSDVRVDSDAFDLTSSGAEAASDSVESDSWGGDTLAEPRVRHSTGHSSHSGVRLSQQILRESSVSSPDKDRGNEGLWSMILRPEDDSVLPVYVHESPFRGQGSVPESQLSDTTMTDRIDLNSNLHPHLVYCY